MTEPRGKANLVVIVLAVGLALATGLLAAEAIGLYLMARQVTQLQRELAVTLAEYDALKVEMEARDSRLDESLPAPGPELVDVASAEGAVPTAPGTDGAFTMDAAEWRALRADMAQLATQVRAIPHRGADGEVDGLRLAAIRHGSLPSRLGFRNGDIVKTVNGHPLADTSAALDAWQAAAGETRFTFEIERRGEPVALVVEVR
jgi:hypothetical protein